MAWRSTWKFGEYPLYDTVWLLPLVKSWLRGCFSFFLFFCFFCFLQYPPKMKSINKGIILLTFCPWSEMNCSLPFLFITRWKNYVNEKIKEVNTNLVAWKFQMRLRRFVPLTRVIIYFPIRLLSIQILAVSRESIKFHHPLPSSPVLVL